MLLKMRVRIFPSFFVPNAPFLGSWPMDYLILQEPLLHSVASPGPSYVDLTLSFPVRPAHKKTNYYSFATILHFNFV